MACWRLLVQFDAVTLPTDLSLPHIQTVEKGLLNSDVGFDHMASNAGK